MAPVRLDTPSERDRAGIARSQTWTVLLIWAGVAIVVLGAVSLALLFMRWLGEVPSDYAWIAIGAAGVVAVVVAASLTSAVFPKPPSSHLARTTAATVFQHVVLGFLPVAVFGVGLAFASLNVSEPSVVLAIVLVTGVIGLLLMLAVVTVFFHALGL